MWPQSNVLERNLVSPGMHVDVLWPINTPKCCFRHSSGCSWAVYVIWQHTLSYWRTSVIRMGHRHGNLCLMGTWLALTGIHMTARIQGFPAVLLHCRKMMVVIVIPDGHFRTNILNLRNWWWMLKTVRIKMIASLCRVTGLYLKPLISCRQMYIHLCKNLSVQLKLFRATF